MKISEKAIRYFENEMNSSEKADFEKELKNSKQLQAEAASYKSLLLKIEETKNIKADEGYLNSIIPQFRLRQAVPHKPLVSKLAFGLAATAIILVLMFSLNKTNEVNTVNQSPSFTSDEIDSIAVNYPEYLTDIDTVIENNEVYSSIVDEMLANELDVSQESLDSVYALQAYVSYYNDNFNNISDEEAQVVYDELINKRLF